VAIRNAEEMAGVAIKDADFTHGPWIVGKKNEKNGK